MPSIRARLATAWQDSAPARAAVASLWQSSTPVRSRGSAYTPPPAPPGATTVVPGSLAPTTQILPGVDFALPGDWRVVDLRDNAELPATDFSLTLEDGSAAWSGTLKGPYELLVALEAGEQPAQVQIEIGAQAFALVIDGADAPQAFASTRVSATGRSLVALADVPYSLATQWTVDAPTTAAQLAAAAQTFTGMRVNWQVDSWLIPAGVWSGSGTPLDVVRQVAGAVGAVIEPEPAGFGLTVRSRYPVMRNLWPYTPPDVQIDWPAVFSHSRSQADKPAYTAIYVAGQQQGAVAQVRLAGTSGAEQAPMITHPLLTDLPALVERGKTELAASGQTRMVTRTIPVLSGAGQPGVLERGALVRWVDPDETWTGMVRSVTVAGSFGRLRQTVTCERPMGFPAGTFVPVPVVPADPLQQSVISFMSFDDAEDTTLPADRKDLIAFQNLPLSSPFSRVKAAQGRFGNAGFYRQQSLTGSISGGLRSQATSLLVGKSWCAELQVRIDGNPFGIGGTKRVLQVGEIQVQAEPKFSIEGQASTSPNYVQGAWYHICLQFDHRTLTVTLFVDGQPVSTKSGFLGYTSPVTIGVGTSDANGDFYIGAVDDWRLTLARRYGSPFTPPDGPLVY